jgi:polysaccharide deacetylase family protein (PEP-CTERM system associated)
MNNRKMNNSNILQIDVEPWYSDLSFKTWERYDNNVPTLTRKILRILDKYNNTATFFVLGEIARDHPDLINDIVDQGHEIGSHGWYHEHLTKSNFKRVREGLAKTEKAIADAGIDSKRVTGYRAPQFSLEYDSRWLLPILDERGYQYDSSIFPTRTPYYGVPDAPKEPYRICPETLDYGGEEDLMEVPLSVLDFPVRNIPVAGGFYLRLFPYPVLRSALRRIQRRRSAVCYVHPWELDPNTPRHQEYGWIRYYNIGSAEDKFTRLNIDFDFSKTEKVIQ